MVGPHLPYPILKFRTVFMDLPHTQSFHFFILLIKAGQPTKNNNISRSIHPH